jgi:hypothetical protein
MNRKAKKMRKTHVPPFQTHRPGFGTHVWFEKWVHDCQPGGPMAGTTTSLKIIMGQMKMHAMMKPAAWKRVMGTGIGGIADMIGM